MAIERNGHQKYGFTLILIVVILTAIIGKPEIASAQDETGQAQGKIIEVEVKGVFCPICAYGIEKKVKKIEGVEKVLVDLKSEKATIVTQASHQHQITEEELREAIKNAGFDAGEIEYIESEKH